MIRTRRGVKSWHRWLGRKPVRCQHPCRPRLKSASIEPLEVRVLLATFTVTNISDAAGGSLRDAVNRANSAENPGLDVIDFLPTLSNQLINLESELLITEALTIDASKLESRVVISGQQKARVFNVTAATGDVSLSNLIIQRGDVIGNGGAIRFVSDGRLTVTNSTIRDSVSRLSQRLDEPGRGGGISVENGSLIINDSAITGNTSTGSSNYGAADGGGIFSSGPVTLSNTMVSGNTAAGTNADGGGINTFGNLILDNSSVDGNQTTGENGNGGGISSSANVTLTGNSFVRNNSTTGNLARGGGIYVASAAETPTLIVANSVINDNSTGGRNSEGGGIFVNGNATLTDSTIAGNTTGHSTSDGGGIAAVTGTLTILNSTISGNTSAGDGGGLAGSGTATMIGDTKILGNKTPYAGGGIYNTGTLTVTNSTITGNSAGDDGGGIDNRSQSSKVTVTDSTISGNTANDDGGAISNRGTASVINSTISGNISNSTGGGIRSYIRLSVTRSTISGNTANEGGGIFSRNYLTLLSSTISGNQSRASGAGIYADNNAVITIQQSTISGNASRGLPGDSDNSDQGGGIYVDPGARVTIQNSTITLNESSRAGAGIAIYSSTDPEAGKVTLINSIVAGNFGGITGSSANDVFGPLESGSSHNLIGDANSAGGLTDGANNNIVGGDPKLGPLQNNGGPVETHALLSGSEAIDAGDDSRLPLDAGDLDGDGNMTEPLPLDQRELLRIVDAPGVTNTTSELDIGAFESQPDKALDPDANGVATALSDGIVILRYLAGFTGTSLTNGVVDENGGRTDADSIIRFLNSFRSSFDIDLNEKSEALSDGILAVRFLAGFTGNALVFGVVDNGAGQRTAAEDITGYLEPMKPPQPLPAEVVGAAARPASRSLRTASATLFADSRQAAFVEPIDLAGHAIGPRMSQRSTGASQATTPSPESVGDGESQPSFHPLDDIFTSPFTPDLEFGI